MAYIREDPIDRIVYAILDPEVKQVYIGKTQPHRQYKTYCEHIHGRVTKSAPLVAALEDLDRLPQMHVLTTASMATYEAFRYQVAWTQYFLDRGYTPVTTDILVAYAGDMVPNTQAIYDEIKDIPLDEVLQPPGGLYPNYGQQRSRTDGQHPQVCIRLTPQEYAQLTEAAEQQKMSVTHYCKRQSLAGQIIQIDFNFLEEYLSAYSDTKSILRQILYTIAKRGEYFPADMRMIQEKVDSLTKFGAECNKAIIKLMNEIRKHG